MEPETLANIKKMDRVSEETAKKLFIRSEALKAYKENRVKENSVGIIKEIIDTISIESMSKEQIGLHIAHLEKARVLLASLTQGYEIAYAEEKEPEFKRKHEERAKVEREAKKKDLLGGLGISKEALLAALSEVNAGAKAPETQSPSLNKTKCENCGKEFLSSMKSFHKC